jgi:ABC-type sugar transport system substrate-binding protein
VRINNITRRPLAAGAVAALVALAAAGCGSSSKDESSAKASGTGGGKVAKSETFQADPKTLDRLYGTTEGVPQPILAAIARADKPVDDATLQLALKCFKADTCDTGRGKLTVALADGFGQNVWRQVTRMEFILQALSYPEVRKIVYTDARGEATKAVSDLRSLIAQKVDIITGFFDAGQAVVPTLRQATQQGIQVAAYDTPIGGTPGTDYLTVVVEDLCTLGQNFAGAIKKETGGKGNVVLLGGTPGNPLSAAWQKCEKEALDPGLKVLGEADTNWTQQGTFQAMNGFLSGGAPINAISYEYGDGFLGGVRAFKAANKPLDLTLTLRNDENNLFCEWKKVNNPKWKIYYSSGGGYYVRLALTAAMMKLQGYDIPGDLVVPQQLHQVDSSTCNPSLPGPAPVSTLVPPQVLKAMFG